MDATAGKKKTVCKATNTLRPTSFTKLKFLTTLTMSIKSIYVQLKLRLGKDITTTREILNIKYISKYIWNLKNQGITPIIKWRILKKVNSKVPSHYGKLCLTEKFFIIKSLDDCNLLNKRPELASKCRHQNKLLVCNEKRNDSMD